MYFIQCDLNVSGEIFENGTSLITKYALSGSGGSAYTAGNGLYLIGNDFNIDQGWGVVVSSSGIYADTADLDTRYALSGNFGSLYAASGYHYAAGSGLIEAAEAYHIGAGWGIIVSDSGISADPSVLSGTFAPLESASAIKYIGFYNHASGVIPNPTYQIGKTYSYDGRYWFNQTDSVIQISGTDWESTHVKDPNASIVSGVIYLYYAGYKASATQWKIGLARSFDNGVTFEKYASNPVLSPSQVWENNGAYDNHTPIVYFDRDETDSTRRWKMWYAGGLFGAGGIGYAYSSDGQTWTKYASNPVLTKGTGGSWDDTYILPGAIAKVGSKFYLFYNGHDGVDTWCVGLATFSNPESTYTKSSDNPILRGDGISSSLTSSVTSGTYLVNVSDATKFPIGCPIHVYDNTNFFLGRVAKWNSTTQLQLVEDAPITITTTGGTVKSVVFNSVNTRCVEYDDGWRFGITAFQPLGGALAGKLKELAVLGYSRDLKQIKIDYSAGLLLKWADKLTTTWTDISKENLNYTSFFTEENRTVIDSIGRLTEGSGLYINGNDLHVGIGSGLYIQDSLIGFDTTWASGQFAPSGNYAQQSDYLLTSGFLTTLSGNFVGLSGVVDNLGTVYAASGYHYAAGSGLIEAGESYHIQVGSGLYLQNDLVGFDTAWASGQYASSGNYAQQSDYLLTSGFLTTLSGDFVGLSGAVSAISGSLPVNYAASGYHYAAGSGLIENTEAYHIQIGSGLYLQDDLVGFNTIFGDDRYSLSGNYQPSGNYAQQADYLLTSGFLTTLNGNFTGLSGVVASISGTVAGLGSVYAASGYHYLAGSGLYESSETYLIDAGWGITVSDSGIISNTTDLDTRYELSGTAATLLADSPGSSFARLFTFMGS